MMYMVCVGYYLVNPWVLSFWNAHVFVHRYAGCPVWVRRGRAGTGAYREQLALRLGRLLGSDRVSFVL